MAGLALALAACADDPAGSTAPDAEVSASHNPSLPVPPVWEANIGAELEVDEDGCFEVPLGFTLRYFGKLYTKAYVHANGVVALNRCFYYPEELDFIFPYDPEVLIAPAYGDLSPATGGGVYVAGSGLPGDRKFVVTWLRVPERLATAEEPNTIQLQIFQRLSLIVFGYGQLSTDGFVGPQPIHAGISSGIGPFVLTASGGDLPALAGHNVCYVGFRGVYREFRDFACLALTGGVPLPPPPEE